MRMLPSKIAPFTVACIVDADSENGEKNLQVQTKADKCGRGLRALA